MAESAEKDGEQNPTNKDTETVEPHALITSEPSPYTSASAEGQTYEVDVDAGEEEEEIVTAQHPPTEVVDTIVTMTKNPDGSLKKTTRKTTRTLVTTTRVRRIRVKPPTGDRTTASGDNSLNDSQSGALMSTSPDQSGMSDTSVEQQPGKLFTFVGQKQLSQDEGENRITQATFTIMTPTSRTEVTYHEDDRPVHTMDPETVKHLQTMREEKIGQSPQGSRKCPIGLDESDTVGEVGAPSSNASTEVPHARTKTTVRKTVIASAAKATFVATGSSKSPKNTLLVLSDSVTPDAEQNVTSVPTEFSQNPLLQVSSEDTTPTDVMADVTEAEQVRILIPSCKGTTASTTTTTTTNTESSSSTTTTTTTTTKRTTRIGNGLVNKSVLFSKASLDSLKKPFAMWTKELKHDSAPIAEGAFQKVESIKIDAEDTDQFALLAMKESERLFSEAKYLVSTNPTTVTTTIVHPSDTDNSEMADSRFQSRFSNLPLYQGYGLIGQQLSLHRQEPHQRKDNEGVNKQSDASYSLNTFEGTASDKAMTDWSTMFMNLTNTTPGSVSSAVPPSTGTELVAYGPGNELSTATTDLLSLLDATTDRLLHEATKQWCTLGYTRFDLPQTNAMIGLSKPIFAGGGNRGIPWTGSLPEEKQFQLISDGEIRQPKKSITSHHSVESLLHDDPPLTDLSKDDLQYVSDRSKTSMEDEPPVKGVESITDKADDHQKEELPRLRGLGVTKPGAFRVAWSEMSEVLSSGVLQKLTKHEIQLQEAMFEVITSEASYYQSLNVLVNHFYHAPEFGCETNTTTHVSSPSMNRPFAPGLTSGSGNKENATRGPSGAVNASAHNSAALASDSNAHLEQNLDSLSSPVSPNPSGASVKRPLLKPLEKHHLFSNVLLVCLASEKFLRDLEARWDAQTPVVSEVCDLIVKHAGGANFEPYITYLRNQAYQLATLRNLCQRESFRNALETLHSNPISGKNSLSSFLALPMQRLTRLKLLVEVIRRLQEAVLRDAAEAEAGNGPKPHRIPTDRERENVQLALCELSRLLASSETEKELMDQKARLLTLSTSLEFMDTVKSIAISDKRLIKEGELREVSADGRISMLQKLSLKKPNSYYFILFNDLLLVTKRKKNDRYLVLDYCERAEIQAEVQRLGDNSTPRPIKATAADDSKLTAALTSPAGFRTPSDKLRTRSGSPIHTYAVRPRRPKTTMDFPRTPTIPSRSDGASPGTGGKSRITGLARSGSSLSSYHIDPHVKFNPFGAVHHSPPSEQAKAEALHLVLTASQNGTFSQMTLLPKDMDDFLSWCKALGISSTPSPSPVIDSLNGKTGAKAFRLSSDSQSAKKKTDF